MIKLRARGPSYPVSFGIAAVKHLILSDAVGQSLGIYRRPVIIYGILVRTRFFLFFYHYY
jgi:hypothetical protein